MGVRKTVLGDGPAVKNWFGGTFFQVSWVAVLLGLVIEVVILLLARGVDTVLEGNDDLIKLLQTFSWSLLG